MSTKIKRKLKTAQKKIVVCKLNDKKKILKKNALKNVRRNFSD